MKRKYTVLILFFALASVFIYNSCKNDDNVSGTTRLDSFGPSGVAHGEDISFIGVGLDQVTSIVMPVGIEIPSSAFKTHTSTLIVLTVPDESTEGKVTLKTPKGDVVSKANFGADYTIAVTSVTPEAKPGTNITITGQFLDYVKQVSFTQGKTVTQFVSQSLTQLVVTVPVDAQSGKIALSDLKTKPQVVESEGLIVTLPKVSDIAPLSLRQAANLTITGTNLDLVTEVDFPGGGKVYLPFVSQSLTQLVVAVPNTAVNGTVTLAVASKVQIPTTQQIVVIEPAVTPPIPTVRAGADVTITGTDLDLVASITFPDGGVGTSVASTAFKSQSPTSIVVTLPADVIPGTLKFVTTHSFVVTPSTPFTVTEPVATDLSTSTPGADMTITGTDLDLVRSVIFPDGSTVTSSSFKSQTTTSIVITIPATATPGTLKFITNNGYTVNVTVAFGGACVTNFPGSSTLYSFDSDLQGWGGGTYQAPVGESMVFTSSEGHSCLGAAALTIPFASYGQNADAEINPGPAMDLTGHTKIHFWAKVQLPSGTSAAFNGIQFFVNTNGYGQYKGNFVSFTATLGDGGSFADGNWHEGLFDLAANSGSITISIVNQFGVQLVTQSSAPGGGPAAPPTAILFLDDVWIE